MPLLPLLYCSRPQSSSCPSGGSEGSHDLDYAITESDGCTAGPESSAKDYSRVDVASDSRL